MINRERRSRGWVCALLSVLAAFSATQVNAEPITTIFINDVNAGSPSLQYDPSGGDDSSGLLSIEIDSLTIIVERLIGGVNVPEFIEEASFTFTAQGFTDASQAPLAAGEFSTLDFELRGGGGELLLAGSQNGGAGLLYGESLTPETMFLNGGEMDITGGTFAADFDIQARLFGLGLFVTPDPSTFASLDVEHAGSVQLNLFPIPEPATLVLAFAGLLTIVSRTSVSRASRRRVV